MAPAEQTTKVEGFIILTLVFRQEDKRWLGRCLELGTSTYGRTLNQTHRELVELVELHLNALEDAGERDRFFGEHNITLYPVGAELAEIRPRVPVDNEYYLHPHKFPISSLAA